MDVTPKLFTTSTLEDLLTGSISGAVADRLALLNGTESTVIKPYEGQGFYSSFISPSSELVLFFNHSRTLRIDDEQIYYVFVACLREGLDLFDAIQATLIRYLGEYIQDEAVSVRRQSYYRRDDPKMFVSIAEMKGMAVCSEKAAIAHNLLQFAGKRSHLVFTDNCEVEGEVGNHAYVIVNHDGSWHIYDPTNRGTIIDEITGVPKRVPALHAINDEDLEQIRTGRSVQVKEQIIVDGRNAVRLIIYGGPGVDVADWLGRALKRIFAKRALG